MRRLVLSSRREIRNSPGNIFPVSHDAVLSMRHPTCSVQFLVHFAPTLLFNENLARRRRVEVVLVRWESIPSS